MVVGVERSLPSYLMPGTPVILTKAAEEEVRAAAGRVAEVYGSGRARMHYHPTGATKLDVSRNGLGAERAIAQYLDLPWGRGDPALPDVGTDIEVRSARRRDSFLLVYDRDALATRFVLVTGSLPAYEIVGWVSGFRAMRPQWWHPANVPAHVAYGGATIIPAEGFWAVQQRFLWPISMLVEAIQNG